MGQEKLGSSEQSSKTTVEASPQEQQLNASNLAMQKALQPYAQESGISFYKSLNALLGGTELPGAYGGLYEGISDEMAQNIAGESIRGIPAQLQGRGLLDSGAGASIMARTYGDTLRNVAQYNVDNLRSLLGEGLGVNYQATPYSGVSSQLSQSLGGLRSTTSSGTATTYGQNPFMRSFQTSLGGALGDPFSAYANIGKGYAGFNPAPTTINF